MKWAYYDCFKKFQNVSNIGRWKKIIFLQNVYPDPTHSSLKFFETAAMPFPFNCLLICCVNLPKVLFMFFNKFASCSIHYFIIFIVDSLALALNSLGWFTYIVQ